MWSWHIGEVITKKNLKCLLLKQIIYTGNQLPNRQVLPLETQYLLPFSAEAEYSICPQLLHVIEVASTGIMYTFNVRGIEEDGSKSNSKHTTAEAASLTQS